MSETWTEKTEQSETWTPNPGREINAFDPASFDHHPSFDTGSSAGTWTVRSEQSETWTES